MVYLSSQRSQKELQERTGIYVPTQKNEFSLRQIDLRFNSILKNKRALKSVLNRHS